MSIDDQLREIARHADQHQQVITTDEIAQRVSRHGNGSLRTGSDLDQRRNGLNHVQAPTARDEAALIDLETPSPTIRHRKGPKRVVVAVLLAAAAVVAIAFVAIRDDPASPADQPSPTVTEVPTVPPRALFGTPDEEFVPGTYYVDEVAGVPTPRIFVTLGEGWTNTIDNWVIRNDVLGAMTFGRPRNVSADACHASEGFHQGPLTTLDGLVTALSEQGGWAAVTTPSDVTVNGYAGKEFQRTAPADFTDCNGGTHDAFRSWNGHAGGWSFYEPGEIETLRVLDVNGTIVLINTRLKPDSRDANAVAGLAAALDSIRIEQVSPRALFGTPDEQFAPGTYFVDEVEGVATPRIWITLDAGWTNLGDGWSIDGQDLGVMTFSRPDRVFTDACHASEGFHAGPVTTLDGLVTALSDQGGWAQVTTPWDVTVNGYAGKQFLRTAPTEFTGCTPGDQAFRSWETGASSWSSYEPGEIETLRVIDVNGTIIIINTRLKPEHQDANAVAGLATTLASIRIDHT